jgi:hypothetical protein
LRAKKPRPRLTQRRGLVGVHMTAEQQPVAVASWHSRRRVNRSSVTTFPRLILGLEGRLGLVEGSASSSMKKAQAFTWAQFVTRLVVEGDQYLDITIPPPHGLKTKFMPNLMTCTMLTVLLSPQLTEPITAYRRERLDAILGELPDDERPARLIGILGQEDPPILIDGGPPGPGPSGAPASFQRAESPATDPCFCSSARGYARCPIHGRRPCGRRSD